MIHDISMTIQNDMVVYKNKAAKKPTFKASATFEKQGVYETDISMNLHTGTHIDFPLHTIENGKTSLTENLDALMGEAKVFDLTHLNDRISKKDIETLDIKANDFVLFKTRNSFEAFFNFEFIYVALDAAKYLKDQKVRGVGIDALGIERNQEGHPTHDTLLENDIIILEGINLKNVDAKPYELICLPLKLHDVEALPVRAILKE